MEKRPVAIENPEELVNQLVPLYLEHPTLVARVCDVFDPTAGLLEKLRDAALAKLDCPNLLREPRA